MHMKSIGLTDRSEIFELFLKYDKDREGYLKAKHIENICKKLHIPSDKDVINEVSKDIISLLKMLKFFQRLKDILV